MVSPAIILCNQNHDAVRLTTKGMPAIGSIHVSSLVAWDVFFVAINLMTMLVKLLRD